MFAIETKQLTKYYGKARGIIDLSLSVKEGDFFGFIGPNGAGKSTTIRTLLGLISATSGEVSLLGMDLPTHKTEVLSMVGYLPSEAAFYHGMKVKDILALSASLHQKDCREESKMLCERLQLDVSRRVDELSLGNRKKVGIVCALQHKPKLYILDEPTSGLDPLMQREFFTLLCERNQEGATVFLSSHNLAEVQRYCKHAAVISEGRLLAMDRIERLGHSGVKRVVLRGVHTSFTLAGAKNIKTEQSTLSFLYGGNLQELLAYLASMEIEDVSISDPDLEEIFMHYYTGEGN